MKKESNVSFSFKLFQKIVYFSKLTSLQRALSTGICLFLRAYNMQENIHTSLELLF